MLTIRFSRVGKKNKAQFRIVLQEHTASPKGRHVEVLGSYDPHQKKGVFKAERIKYWISKGVKISDSVYNLFVRQGIISGKKRAKKIKTKAKAGEDVKIEDKPKIEVSEKEEGEERSKKSEEKSVKGGSLPAGGHGASGGKVEEPKKE